MPILREIIEDKMIRFNRVRLNGENEIWDMTTLTCEIDDDERRCGGCGGPLSVDGICDCKGESESGGDAQ
jgi:hypothetical protein